MPIKSLGGFERVSVAASATEEIDFHLTSDALKLVDAKGARVLYPGKHTLIFSRGHGEELEFDFTVA